MVNMPFNTYSDNNKTKVKGFKQNLVKTHLQHNYFYKTQGYKVQSKLSLSLATCFLSIGSYSK